MGTSRTTTERQVAEARAALSKHSEHLASKGVAKDNFSSDTKWRKLDAQVRQISKRVNKLNQIDAVNAELASRRDESAEAE